MCYAAVAELVDALVLGTSGAIHEGSSPFSRIMINIDSLDIMVSTLYKRAIAYITIHSIKTVKRLRVALIRSLDV